MGWSCSPKHEPCWLQVRSTAAPSAAQKRVKCLAFPMRFRIRKRLPQPHTSNRQRSYQAEEVAQTRSVMQGSFPGSGGHFHLEKCLLGPFQPKVFYESMILWFLWHACCSCSFRSLHMCFTMCLVSWVRHFWLSLLTYSSVSQRTLELVAPIIAVPQMRQTRWSVDDQPSVVLLIYIQFISVPDNPLPCSVLFTARVVVLSDLPFLPFLHRLKKPHLLLCASFLFLSMGTLSTYTTDTCRI